MNTLQRSLSPKLRKSWSGGKRYYFRRGNLNHLKYNLRLTYVFCARSSETSTWSISRVLFARICLSTSRKIGGRVSAGASQMKLALEWTRNASSAKQRILWRRWVKEILTDSIVHATERGTRMKIWKKSWIEPLLTSLIVIDFRGKLKRLTIYSGAQIQPARKKLRKINGIRKD